MDWFSEKVFWVSFIIWVIVLFLKRLEVFIMKINVVWNGESR